MKISYIVSEKKKRGIEVYTVPYDATLKDAAVLMNKYNVGALLITDSEDKKIGIISERDIIHHCADPEPLDKVKVADVARKDMIVITEEDTLETARGIMSRHHIRHLPVIIGKEVGGMVSIRDIINVIEEQQDIRIKHLSDFVGGTYGNQVS